MPFKDEVWEMKYYINKNNYNEYLFINRNLNNYVLDITNNYLKIYEQYKYYDARILAFPNKNDGYFIFTKHECHNINSDDVSDEYETTSTSAYTIFNKENFQIDYKEGSSTDIFKLLLSWYN